MLIQGETLHDFAWSARPYLVAYVRRFSAGQLDPSTDAEDLVQRVYQRAVLHAALLRDRRPVAMRRWLRRTARGVLSDALAAQRAGKRGGADGPGPSWCTLSLVSAEFHESPPESASPLTSPRRAGTLPESPCVGRMCIGRFRAEAAHANPILRKDREMASARLHGRGPAQLKPAALAGMILAAALCSDCSVQDEPRRTVACRTCLLVFPTFQFGRDQPAFRARDERGVEFSVYADQTEGGLQITQIDTVLTNEDQTTLTVRTPVDADGLPTRMESADDTTATLAIDKASGRAVVGVIDKFGAQFNKEVSLSPTTTARVKSQTAYRTGASAEQRLCDLAANYSEVLRLVFNCDDDSDSPFCQGALVETAVASESFCRLLQQIVAQLDSGVEPGPALPFGVGVVAISQQRARSLDAELAAAGFAGREPIGYRWDVVEGPPASAITDETEQFAQVTFAQEGSYRVRVTATDADGQEVIDLLPFNVLFPCENGPFFLLTRSVRGAGRVDPQAGQDCLLAGSEACVRATPDAGHYFAAWLGDATGFNLSNRVVMDTDRSIRARFEPVPSGRVVLEVDAFPCGAGSITLDPPGPLFEPGQEVRLTAQAVSGFVFDRFSGDVSGPENPRTAVIDVNMRVTAEFRR